jgi:hypothetical protein
MKVLSNQIHSLWMALLVALLAMLSVPFAMDALGMQVSSIAYDGQVQPSIAYDGPLLTALDYDAGPVPVADENGNQITGRIRTVGAFVDIAEFQGGTQRQFLQPRLSNAPKSVVLSRRFSRTPLSRGERKSSSRDGPRVLTQN